MNSINLCAVVASNTMNEVVSQIKQHKNITQYVEVRSDYLTNQDNIDLSMMKNITTQKIIVTCRRKDEGGKWKGSETDRIEILKRAFDLGFLVDIELHTLEEGKLKLNSDMEKRAIVSFHDFTKTPSFHELEKVIIRMQKYSPKIKKIATMIASNNDKETLFRLLINRKDTERLCVIGMGGLGKTTRILSPLLGGEMTYCTIDIKGETAPGQMSCKKMIEIYKLMS